MTEPEGAPAPWWSFEGYGLTLITLACFLVLTLLARMFYPFLPFFVTVASTRPFPRFEAQLSRWLLAAAFLAMTVVTLVTLPEEVHPNDGPRCPGWGPPLCPELKEWWDGHLRARGQHERGIALLGWSSFVAVAVLSVRLSQVWRGPVPRNRWGGISAVPKDLPRLLSIYFLGLNGLFLWVCWVVFAFEMTES